MKKGQTSIRGGVQDVLCPFQYVAITQGANGAYSHRGTMACDIGYKNDKFEPYYAPCDLKCVWTLPSYGQAMWQSLKKVRYANGTVDYLTIVTAHDSSFNAKVGQVIKQGVQLGNKGIKGANGYHCHIECGRGLYTVDNWKQNKYGIWCMPNEVDFDSVFFMDNTEIKNTEESVYAKWVYLKDVPVNVPSGGKKLYLPSSATKWRVYPTNKKPVVGNECGYLYPSKFGGLTYDVLATPMSDVVTIQTRDYGRVNIYVGSSTGATIK